MDGDRHGIWLCDFGGGRRFVAVRAREDLEGEEVQRALQQARGTWARAVLHCGCSPEPGARAIMLPRVRLGTSTLSCVRVRIDDHARDCVFATIYGRPESLRLSDAVFGDGVEGTARPAPSPVATCPEQTRSITFAHLASLLVSESCLSAFCGANPRPPYLHQPTLRDFFGAWCRALQMPRFAGGADAGAAAAQHGVRLRIGLLLSRLAPALCDEELLPVLWWDSARGAMASTVNVVSAEVLASGARSVRGRQGMVPPPYLVVAVVRPDGRLTHLWLRAVWTDGESFLLVESHAERSYFGQLPGRGATVYRPFLRRELDLLTRHLRLPRFVSWDHRPDLLEFTAAGRPTIVELRGYREGVFPDYDTNFAAAQASYRRAADLFHARTVDLWTLPAARCKYSPESWLVRSHQVVGLSPAAAAHVVLVAAQVLAGEVQP
jgi:hypothetical protein